MNLNNNDTQQLIDIIKKIIKQELKNNLTNIEYSYFGEIESYSGGGKYNVKIPSDGSIYSDLLNQTGTSLSVGDSVIIRAKNNNFGNAYIAVKSKSVVGAPPTPPNPVNMVTSLPAATSDLRGKIYLLLGGTRVEDKPYICVKTTNETYIWLSI